MPWPTTASDECPSVIRGKSGKTAKNGDEFCLDEDCGLCVGLTTLFVEKGCVDLVTENPLDECSTLPALKELALDQIPKCELLLLYGVLGGCLEQVCDSECYGDAFPFLDVADAGAQSATDGTLFGLKMDDLNVIIRASLPADFHI